MDESVIRAVAKWPNVPAVYGWLSLDRRGDWRLQGERLTHRGAVAFINRNYASDVRGCWYVQNGPQRVYVTLEYTPWVYALTAQGELVSHNGRLVDALESGRLRTQIGGRPALLLRPATAKKLALAFRNVGTHGQFNN
jgi:hypothetical protein